MVNIIDKIQKKTGYDSFSDYLISTDAKLINTLDGIDLEKLLRIGTRCWTTQTQDAQGNKIVIKKFGKIQVLQMTTVTASGSIKTIDPSIEYPYFQLESKYQTKEDKIISTATSGGDNIIIDDTPTYLVAREQIQANYEKIIHNLYYYKNEQDDPILLKTKYTYLLPNNQTIDMYPSDNDD